MSREGSIVSAGLELGAEELIAGRFRVESELGRGGMGAVYRAHDDYLDQVCALKVSRANGVARDEFKRRFEREARIGELLGRQPGFVRTYAWGELDQDTLYAAMDLVEDAGALDLESGSLQQRLERLLEVAGLVAQAHEKGVIHRDLKPGNVFVGADGRAWLGDFGLAKYGDQTDDPVLDLTLTNTGMAMGTPYFMPPEQFEDAKSVDERADVYALGVMLFYALTGSYPYLGNSPAQILSSQLRVRLGASAQPRARELDPQVAPALDTLCAEATAPDLRRRLSSARVFTDRLAKALERGLAQPAPQGQTAVGSPVSQVSAPAAVVRRLEPEGPSPLRANALPLGLAVGACVVLTGLLLFPALTSLRTQAPDVAARPQPTTAAADRWEELTRRAREGDLQAQLELASLYYDAGDSQEAFRLREEAALDGLPRAMLEVGEMYHRGIGVEKSLELARAWFEKAAEAGERLGAERAAVIEQLLANAERVERERAAKEEEVERWKQHHTSVGSRPKTAAQMREERREATRRKLEERRQRYEAERQRREAARRSSSSSSRPSSAGSPRAGASPQRPQTAEERRREREAQARAAPQQRDLERAKSENERLREQLERDRRQREEEKRRPKPIIIMGGAGSTGSVILDGQDPQGSPSPRRRR
ncbi:MAG: serine/threonine protein kinase [Planctomycetota bacterium]